MKAYVTLNAIRKHSPCECGWKKLLDTLGKTKADDEPLSLLTILASNGIDDAIWALRALPAEMDGKVRLLVCDIAERALRFVPAGEDRPRKAIETARCFAVGEATDAELAAADAAAWAYVKVAEGYAARYAAGTAARSAAGYAARYAAGDVAWSVAGYVAWFVAGPAARPVARDAERAEQAAIFRRHITGWESAS